MSHSPDSDNSDDARESLATVLARLVSFLDQQGEPRLDEIIQKIKTKTHQYVFTELGGLTRELHDSLASFSVDVKLDDLTKNDFPETIMNLDSVIEFTEDAVHNTLSAVESARIAMDSLQDSAAAQGSEHHQTHLTTIDQALNDILIAQSFQDLSGQTIRKVMEVTYRAQTRLIRLLCDLGDVTELSGRPPSTTQPIKKDKKTTQDEIDEILSGFGFD